jgi:hypothetical protein
MLLVETTSFFSLLNTEPWLYIIQTTLDQQQFFEIIDILHT